MIQCSRGESLVVRLLAPFAYWVLLGPVRLLGPVSLLVRLLASPTRGVRLLGESLVVGLLGPPALLNPPPQISGNNFAVWFNDMPVGDGAKAWGFFSQWGDPLPQQQYMNLYFDAPARWSSGLSMTGLFSNYNGDAGDDWEAISPSTMWWVKGTMNSAFTNPEYLLSWDNRIVKAPPKGGSTAGRPVQLAGRKVGTALAQRGATGEDVSETGWTRRDEVEALRVVDPLTAKMRRRLFAKMARQGAIERRPGQPRPTQGLAAAELDIMPYAGENPSPMRVEQQMLFRKEWRKLRPAARGQMLAGAVVSDGNAVGMDRMCQECIKGSEQCQTLGITADPAVGIIYDSEQAKATCHENCVPWVDIKTTRAVCKCWIDCAAGTPAANLAREATLNYVAARIMSMVVDAGEGSCILMGSPVASRYLAKEYRPSEWAPNFDNFAVTLWYKVKSICFSILACIVFHLFSASKWSNYM